MNREERDELVTESMKDSPQVTSKGFRILCPFCVSSKTNRPDHSMFVNGQSGRYKCYRCETYGVLPGFEGSEFEESEAPMFEAPEGFYQLFSPEGIKSVVLTPARAYVLSRGLDVPVCIEAGVGACISGRMRGRVVVPILDEMGLQWRGYVGRDWTCQRDRPYDYPPDMRRYDLLYNPGALLDPAGVLVMEGVLDALHYWPNAVAVLGKPGVVQKQMLVRAVGPVAIVLDGDAWEEGWALAMELRLEGKTAGAVRLPPKTDPDEVPKDLVIKAAELCLETTEAVCV